MSSSAAVDTDNMWSRACFLTRLIAASVKISEAAGNVIKKTAHDANLQTVNKSKTGGRDPQTVADRKSQYVVLYSLRKHFGDELTIIGEEGDNMEQDALEEGVSTDVLAIDNQIKGELRDITAKDVVVWVDPLDGTKEFTKGIENKRASMPEVTVLIGIAYKGEAFAGIIHQPLYQPGDVSRTVWGLRGVGCFGITIPEPPNDRIAVSSSSHASTVIDDTLKVIRDRSLISDVIKVGGAGNKVLRILSDASAYIYPSRGTKKWDTAAPEAILLAAGGKLTDASGRPLPYSADAQRMNSGGVIATAPWMVDKHDEIVDAVPQSIKNNLPEHATPSPS